MARQSRHFVVLDGFRGLAALAVVTMHASLVLKFDYWLPHGRLAVDFFFCLSGFVIAHAYDEGFAQGRIDLPSFARKRIIRLHPMILLGVALGTVTTLIAATHGAPQPIWRVLLLGVAASLLIPGGILFHLVTFPVNPPLWSLFFEGIANGLYGLEGALGRRRSPGLLAMAASAGLLIAVAARYGTIDVGFEKSYWFIGGLARVIFSFLAGVLISRSGLHLRAPKIPDYVLAVVLAAMLFAPSFRFDLIYDLTAILVIFPAIVACGAQQSSSAAANRLWLVLGELSYPLYAIHWPVLSAMAKVQHHLLKSNSQPLIAALGIGAATAAAWLALKLYDEPVRAWLSTRPWRGRSMIGAGTVLADPATERE